MIFLHFRDELARVRKQVLCCSGYRLAAMVGVSQSYISKINKGSHTKLRRLIDVCDALQQSGLVPDNDIVGLRNAISRDLQNVTCAPEVNPSTPNILLVFPPKLQEHLHRIGEAAISRPDVLALVANLASALTLNPSKDS